MNGLYGYKSSPCGGYLGVMGADDSEKARPWLMSIIDGSLYRELKDTRVEQKLNNVKVVEAQMAIDKMPAGPVKDRAFAQWREVKTANDALQRKIEEAANKYDAIVSDVRTFSGGAITPQFLGAFPVAAVAAILAASAAAILALATLVAAIRMDKDTVKQMFSTLSDTVKVGGGVITEGPKAISDWMKTGLYVTAGGLGLFVLYKVFSQWEKGKTTFELPRFVKATAAPKTIAEVAVS